MSQEEFDTACAAAIKDYHDSEQDGPLLTNLRPTAIYLGLTTGWQVWPNYAAVLGYWPDSRNGTNYGQYCEDPEEAIEALVREAKGYWQARQPEPAEDAAEAEIDNMVLRVISQHGPNQLL